LARSGHVLSETAGAGRDFVPNGLIVLSLHRRGRPNFSPPGPLSGGWSHRFEPSRPIRRRFSPKSGTGLARASSRTARPASRGRVGFLGDRCNRRSLR
jgi:hypothetical protein